MTDEASPREAPAPTPGRADERTDIEDRPLHRATTVELPPSPHATAENARADLPDEVRRAVAEPSRRVKGYVLLEELGRGGMGVVYRAFDTTLRRHVALKMIVDPLRSEELVHRFEREASAAARLRHPSIVTIHEVGVDAGRPFLVMDLIDGESLESSLRRAALPPRRVAEVVREIALALAHAHERGILHRDVKPENVLVDRQGRAHLMDFGVALDLAERERLTATGTLLGTPAYMAPEQASGEGREGPAVDVYGIGAVLYRALAGRPPFEGASVRALMKKVLFDDPVPPRRVDARVHVDLETIGLRCLAKAPSRRYRTAAEVAEELRRFLDGEPILARPVGRLERAGLWVRRNRPLAGALAALVLVVLGSGAVELGRAYARRREREADAAAERAARRVEVEAVIARARAAPFDLDDDDFKNAVFTLVRATDPDIVALLGRALDETAAELRSAVRETLLAARTPTPEEARAGEVEVAGLDAALERWLARPLDAVSPERGAPAIAAATRRLEVREARRYTGPAKSTAPSVRSILALAQGRRLGPGGLRVERLACEALGRMGIREVVVAAVGRVVLSEEDALRASHAAIALSRLGGAEAEGLVLAGKGRFQSSGTAYWTRTAPHFRGRTATEGSATTAPELVRMATDRIDAGDLDGAVADLSRALDLDPMLAEAWLRRGTARIRQHRWDEAFAGLSRALELDPRSPIAWSARGTARLNLGEPDAAIADWTRAIDIDPLAVRSFLSRAEARRRKGDLDGAAADFSRVLELDPSEPYAWFGRGEVRRARGEHDGALVDLTRAIELAPGVPEPWRARAELRRARGQLDLAIEDHTRAVELRPRDPEVWIERGLTRGVGGDHAGAIEDFTRAIELAPKSAVAFACRAAHRRLAGQLEAALVDASQAIALDASLSTGWTCRGVVHVQRGDLDEALADLDRAIALDPGAFDALQARSTARASKGDWKGALADASRALALAPRNPVVLTHRAQIRSESGDFAGAAEDATRAIELAPTLALAWVARARARAGRDPEGALSDLSRALELDPCYVDAWRTRGALRLDRGQVDGALADLSRACELASPEAHLLAMRSEARRRKGDVAAALLDATRAIELDPNTPDGWLVRGRAREALGDRAGAVADLERFLELASPKDARRAAAREQIRRLRAQRDGGPREAPSDGG